MNKQTNIPSWVPLVALAVSCAATTLSVEAAEADAPAIQTLVPYVVVATRTPLTLDRVSPSVSYISAEAMEFWQDRRVVDALERETGAILRSNGAPGTATSLFLRGTESNHTGFFLDGRRLNPSTSGQYDLESLSLNNLSSVQLQKGASSVNYGSNGIGGVVDLRTADTYGYTDEGATVEGELGSNNYYRASGSALVARDNWGLSIGASTLTTENERDNDDFETTSVTGRFDYEIVDDLTFEVLGTYSDTEKGIAGPLSSPSPSDVGETENWLISPGMKYITDVVIAHVFYSRGEFENDATATSFPTISNIETDEVSLQIDYTVTERALLTLGGLYRNDKLRRESTSQFNERLEQAGGFAQLLYEVSEAFEVRAGLRFDDYSDYDEAWTGNIEAIYRFDEQNLSVFAKLSESYAPPTALDLAFDSNQNPDGSPANTPLQPEASVSYELGLRQSLFEDQLEWSLVMFRNEIDELVQYLGHGAPLYYSDTYNVGKARTEGVELGVDYAATSKVNLGLGYTYLTAENEETGQRLLRRARHTLQLSADYFITDYLSLGAIGTGYFDSEEVGNVDHEDSFVVDLVANWDVNDRWSIFARAENVLDEKYESVAGYPSLGRAGYIGARLRF
jgi:vitamin B12 transporter